MVYRILNSEEWQKLVDYMSRYNQLAPSPETSIVAVAENSAGHIVGVMIQQLQWHREPLILDNPAVRFDRLNEVLNEAFAPYPGTVYYAFTDQPSVLGIAEAIGMQPQDGVLLKGMN